MRENHIDICIIFDLINYLHSRYKNLYFTDFSDNILSRYDIVLYILTITLSEFEYLIYKNSYNI
jgi:hypothetical protein